MEPNELIPLIFGGSVLFTVAVVAISALCTLVPLGVLGYFGYLFFRNAQQKGKVRQALVASSHAWPTTAGKIIKSRVEVRGGDVTSVEPRVAYEYSVDGRGYQNDEIRLGDRLRVVRVANSTAAYDTVDRYPVGAAVTVHYNPANPAESALEKA